MPTPTPSIQELLDDMMYWENQSMSVDPGSAGFNLYDDATFNYFDYNTWLQDYGFALPVWGSRGEEIDLINWASEEKLSQIESRLRRDIAVNETNLGVGGIVGKGTFGSGSATRKFQQDSLINLYERYGQEQSIYDAYQNDLYNSFADLTNVGAFDEDVIADYVESGNWEEYQEYLAENPDEENPGYFGGEFLETEGYYGTFFDACSSLVNDLSSGWNDYLGGGGSIDYDSWLQNQLLNYHVSTDGTYSESGAAGTTNATHCFQP